MSLTDELTGLPNRRAFMRRMEDEVARVQRYGFPLSFALIDLDRFKSINDEFGHAAGAEVLRVYSRNIMTVFRHHDMVARYGEFVRYRPAFDRATAVLWFAPLILLLLAAVTVFMVLRRRDRSDTPALDAAEQQRLQELLSDAGKHSR